MPEQSVALEQQPVAIPQPVAPIAEVVTDDDQTTAVEATAPPEGEQPTETKPPTDEQPEKPGKNRFERRLDRAYRREAEAKARADLLEKRLAELESKNAPPQQLGEGEPRLEQFDDIEKYAVAKAEYKSKKAIEAYEASQRQTQAKAAQTNLARTWEEKAARGDSKYDDFEEVVGEITPTLPWSTAIIRAQNGEDVAYHLGKNLKEASRIAALEPIDQILAIGELSAKLRATPPTARVPSKAPPPIEPVTGKSSTASESPSEEDSMRDWIKKRQKQVHKR